MKKKIWIGLGIAAVIAGMITVSVLQQTDAAGPFQVTALKSQVIQERLTTSGTLAAGNQQMVYIQPDRGELKRILVKPGQKVKKGARLVEYENPALDGEKEQAELQIKTVNIRLNSLYKQRKELNKTSTTPPPDDSERGAPTASPVSPVSKEEINQQIQLTKLELEQAKKQLEVVKTRISRLVVTSEQDGTVVEVNEHSGIGTNTEPLVVVADLSQLKVTANISEYDAIKVKEGQKATIKSDVIPDEEWSAQVKTVGFLPKSNPVAEASNGEGQVIYPVELLLKEAVPIKLGSRLIVEITISADQVMSLPVSAVQEKEEQAFVYVVEQGKAMKKEVKTGKRDDQSIEIVSGITANQQVILAPSADLTSGTEVEIR